MFRSAALLIVLAGFTAANFSAQQTTQTAGSAAAAEKSSTSTLAPANAEDWTKLPVDRAKLKVILPGLSLGKMETPAYSRELVRLEWRYGDPIDMYIVKPHGVDKPRVVLYLYSYPTDVDYFMNDGWCRRATSKGLAAAGFVSALTGDRFRNRPMREWFIPELQESLGSSVHDVQLIIDYLSAREDLSASQVGMFGQGSGATIAILAAAADPRIRALDLLNPWGDWPDWLKSSPVVPEEERARYLTPEFLQKVSMLDPVTYLPQLSDRALRVQQVMNLPDTPAAARDKIAAVVPHDRLAQFKDVAAHRESWKVTGLSGWMATQLLPVPQPGAQGAAIGSK
ncbi:MAG: alpha/beta hydrolase [Terracidiphilus sp.]|jgi:pimeloyl-ACP methyl ester carboxylesterase